MAIAKSGAILILCFALAYNAAGGAKKADPVAGPDIFGKQNVAKDVILPGEKIYNVKDFGAIDDGETDNTQAFMDAWRKTCHETIGPARLLVPAGRYLLSSMFFNGPCIATSPVTFEIIGTVLATTDISEYPNNDWLLFQHHDGFKMIGGGTFDGQGIHSWEHSENCESADDAGCARSPSNLYFSASHNLIIQNIKSVNPKGFHLFVTGCTNVRLRKLKLVAPETSPNTDGIHVSHSDNIIISRSNIATGDDCVSLLNGITNIFINKVKCGPGHGLSIGSLGKYPDEGVVRGIRIKNCTLSGTTNGLRVKTWPDKYPNTASDISFTDIVMNDVKNPIIIDQEYECDEVCTKKPSLVKLQSIHFANVRGTTTTPLAVDLRCSKQFPCEGVTFRDIDLRIGLNPTTSRCINTRPRFEGLLMPPACA